MSRPLVNGITSRDAFSRSAVAGRDHWVGCLGVLGLGSGVLHDGGGPQDAVERVPHFVLGLPAVAGFVPCASPAVAWPATPR
jgi:hypothetical protein